ncbi:MAG: hypothetical protein LBK42_12780 [Propionibacteriaceae bacterium]|jgi:hypothetical protein|nr:hypothetical protein [Propionibacteriaceae bacterium]
MPDDVTLDDPDGNELGDDPAAVDDDGPVVVDGDDADGDDLAADDGSFAAGDDDPAGAGDEMVEPLPQPPATGHAWIDAALAGLADLDQAAVDQHPARLARAHETLRAALDPDDAETPAPGLFSAPGRSDDSSATLPTGAGSV